MALTGGVADSMEHWKNAAIYGAISPVSMFAAIYIFWNSAIGMDNADESEAEKELRLEQMKQDTSAARTSS